MNLIKRAIKQVGGLSAMGRFCGVQYTAVRRWRDNNRLPRTELTGETNYAADIEHATHGRITREQLLEQTRIAWKRGRKSVA